MFAVRVCAIGERDLAEETPRGPTGAPEVILFSLAFTESYITRLFTRALPSILSLPVNEPIQLLLATAAQDKALTESYLKKQPHPATIIATKFTGSEDKTQLASHLLRQAVKFCIEKNEIFCAVIPDLIYSTNFLLNALRFHHITGKVVATFNGRIEEHNLDLGLSPLDNFFLHRNRTWRDNTTTDEETTPGTTIGHMIYEAPGCRVVFGSAPNPSLGRFKPEDLLLLAGPRGIRKWDHAWVDYLENNNRLFVQTDLRLGMSIEPETEAVKKTDRYEREIFDGATQEIARAAKFNGRTWCFTG